MTQQRPVIGIPCDVKTIGKWQFHTVGDKYIQAAQNAVGDVLLLPALADHNTLARLLPLVDGLYLTGAYSDIEPHHYRDQSADDDALRDPARDNTTLPLIRTAVDMGLPVFGICRGLQEVNVALGGTLHQKIQILPGKSDHRGKGDTLDEEYGEAHEINLADGSLIKQWLGMDKIKVNSVHQQGIRDLAAGLSVEATASDGIIEAVRIDAAPLFGYAVQWHPEWQYQSNTVSKALFHAFQAACVRYHQNK
ncbi:gamma-glutamyl-gamma-aminobutyrate hydrolase family protein [Stenoxybacter acetivorans]|uniref:gamma-glutamyl-gamma-aminobutyrate hydrolase family protein n=1 Tax=Stenoxybacter acetivorans TaxID=422441 RepID=UPI00055E7578|nr:gamma-glutamyl-gamma-aminobutyrate hydrolase family protein [Stenoxybacter acetivorans]